MYDNSEQFQSMNENASAVKAPEEQFDDSESPLISLLISLAKHRKLIVLFPLVVAVIVALISLMIPNVYRAGVKLLPPQQAQSGAAGLLSQLGGRREAWRAAWQD
ncbi:Wzz/FepE/Etk N-terminal domain-containing protein [Massilia cavernae]|uniref:Wzz/FepE/Etk N-terminal domain-containing protein n=1 Tax=Massilia cavernae TaxID=2320864 RepID=UPI001E2B5699|nr:Wzz/FepE/Etk N-terminal domain-containing protein [Massilia cavernae]